MEILLHRVEVSDEAQKTAALEAVRKEFYPAENHEAFVARNHQFTLYDSENFLKNIEDKSFGGDIFTIIDETGVVGVSQIKYFKYDLIRPQLYFFPNFEADGKTIASIYLSQLGKEVEKRNLEKKIEISAELAYYWVRPEMRGKGLGKEIEQLELNPFMFNVRKESEATRILAIKYGMKFYGYFRNLSPVYGVVK